MIKLKGLLSHHRVLFLVLLGICLWIIYSPQFSHDALLQFDDETVIKNMRDIFNLHDYITAWKLGTIYDLQPMRDFVTWIDYWLFRGFSISVFHLTNVFIWSMTMLGLYELGRASRFLSIRANLLFVLLIACNPLYIPAVSWLTARKHILAACFTVWATYHFYLWVNQRQSYIRLFLLSFFYALALASQPITLLWPVFLLIFLAVSKKLKLTAYLLPLFLLMGTCAYLNFHYYSSPAYLALSFGVPKYSVIYNEIIPVRLFALGRYLFQVIAPYWTSISFYDIKSWRNLAGIFLIPLSAFYFYKTVSLRTFILGVSFFGLMLMPVLFRMTQIFGMDTYLVTASFGFYFILADSFKLRVFKFRKFAFYLSSSLLLCFLFLGHERASAWNSDLGVFSQAREIEGGDFANEEYIRALLIANRLREAVWYAQDFLLRDPGDELAQGAISFAIASDPSLEKAAKLKKLDELKFIDPMTLSLAAGLEFQSKHFSRSEKLLLYTLHEPSWFRVVAPNPEDFGARMVASCEHGSKKDCTDKLKQLKAMPGIRWDIIKYRLAQIKWESKARELQSEK